MLKGKTVIELTNQQTKEVEKIEDTNMVTDVLEQILTLNPCGMICNAKKKEFFPIINKLLGGILLYENRIEEDKNIVFVPTTNNCIGYAGQTAGDLENVLQGSLNKQESKETGNGYKFVWDFGTSKANGKISSLCLTNAKAGEVYYGTKKKRAESMVLLSSEEYSSIPDEIWAKYTYSFEGDFVNNTLTSCWVENKTLVFKKFREPFLKYKFSDNFDFFLEKPLKEFSVILKKIGSFDPKTGCVYYDEKNYYFLISKVSGQNTNIYKMTIDKEDASYEETILTLENIKLSKLGSYYDDHKTHSLLRGEYVYAYDSDTAKIVKFNINNPVDVSILESDFRLYQGYDSSYNCTLYQVGNMIGGLNFVIDENDKVYNTAEKYFLFGSKPISYGPFVILYQKVKRGYSDPQYYRHLYLVSPYAATINNLSKDVEKTADKTMKIIYTISGGNENESNS